MPESKVSICNLALSHIGIGQGIFNVDTDPSPEAAACRLLWNISREMLLRDFTWSFARRFAILALVEQSPNKRWEYSYREPSDCLYVRRLLAEGSIREEIDVSLIEYERAADSVGPLIYTDFADAEIEYTADITDPTFFPSDFTMALSLLIAHQIAPRLTAGDAAKLGQRAFEMYRLLVRDAMVNDANQRQSAAEPDSAYTRARR